MAASFVAAGVAVVAAPIAGDRLLAGTGRELASDRLVDDEVAWLVVVRRVVRPGPGESLRDRGLPGEADDQPRLPAEVPVREGHP